MKLSTRIKRAAEHWWLRAPASLSIVWTGADVQDPGPHLFAVRVGECNSVRNSVHVATQLGILSVSRVSS